jgi:hypothetical protein
MKKTTHFRQANIYFHESERLAILTDKENAAKTKQNLIQQTFFGKKKKIIIIIKIVQAQHSSQTLHFLMFKQKKNSHQSILEVAIV